MNETEKLNLAEGKEKTAKAFQDAMDKARGFFLVLGVDMGEGTRVVGAFGGLMAPELPRKVATKASILTLALDGIIPFAEAMKEGGEDVHIN